MSNLSENVASTVQPIIKTLHGGRAMVPDGLSSRSASPSSIPGWSCILGGLSKGQKVEILLEVTYEKDLLLVDTLDS